MNHVELGLQGVPFLNRELDGGQNNEGSREEIVFLTILKWNMGLQLPRATLKIFPSRTVNRI